MSRNYRFMLEVRNAPVTIHPPIHDIAKNWMTSIRDYYQTEDYFGIWGESHLGGGMSEQEAHDALRSQIKEISPDAKVNSYWQMLEEWDCSFEE